MRSEWKIQKYHEQQYPWNKYHENTKIPTTVRSEWDKLSLKLQTLSSQSAQTGGLRVESWTGKRSRSWTRRTASTSRCSVRVWRRASIRRQRWDHGILKVSPLNMKSDLTALFYCYSGVGYCYLWSFLWTFCTSCWKCLVACLDIVKTSPICYRQINSWPSLNTEFGIVKLVIWRDGKYCDKENFMPHEDHVKMVLRF